METLNDIDKFIEHLENEAAEVEGYAESRVSFIYILIRDLKTKREELERNEQITRN